MKRIIRKYCVLAAVTSLVSLACVQGFAESVISVEIRKGKVVDFNVPVSSILVADPNVADVEVKSPKQIFVYAKMLGETSIYAFDEKEKQVLGAVVKVTPNISGLDKMVKDTAPDADVKYKSTDKGLVLEGSVKDPITAEQVARLAQGYSEQPVVNMMKVSGPNQVTLRVRIAEVNKKNLKSFGINMENLLTRGDFLFGLATGRGLYDDDGLLARSGTSDSVYLGKGGSDFNALIDALAEESLANLLAEPTLTAVTGKPANFIAGGRVPIPVPSDDGSIGIEYREYGVILNFLPTILSDNKISLQVSPEVSIPKLSEVTILGGRIYEFDVRSANTTVELGSGQSLAIAGLLQSNVNNSVRRLPWIGDVPVLGTLFRSTAYQNNETELVIVVTPYLVKPVNDQEIVLPNDRYGTPNDFERVFLGKLFEERDPAVAIDNSKIANVMKGLDKHNGSIGYILE